MLHARRLRLAELARREAEGETLWSADFPTAVRVKLLYALDDVIPEFEDLRAVLRQARRMILRDEGWSALMTIPTGSDAHMQMREFLTIGPVDYVPTAVEAIAQSISAVYAGEAAGFEAAFGERVNLALAEHRVSYELVNRVMVEKESQELHEEVVAPALRLLSGRPRWDNVERAYRKALIEISDGEPDDAITDAASALQEALVLLGCTGNSLGPLARSARSKGLFAPHDVKLEAAIQSVVDWVNADRTETGEAHRVSTATPEDAWLVVHIVGALILRLATGAGRGQ